MANKKRMPEAQLIKQVQKLADMYNYTKSDIKTIFPGLEDKIVIKKKLAKGGTMVAKKKMRGGGMAKMAKKKMRGGGVAAKKMRGGGMAKMAKKKMMRGGMAKKK